MKPTIGSIPLVAGSSLAGAAAWIFFAARPPMHALAGTTTLAALVPAHYQACVFPAFFAFVAAAASEARRDHARARRRAAVIAITGALAIVRLSGAIPLSGHALFAGAMIAFEVRRPPPPPDDRRLFRLVLAAAAVAVTSFYKLFVWGDAAWLAASLAAGAAIGALSRGGAPRVAE